MTSVVSEQPFLVIFRHQIGLEANKYERDML